MSRYLGTNLANLTDVISSAATRNSFIKNDFYTQNIKRENSSNYYYRCLDLSDRSLSISPLARYHQVVISGDYWEPDKEQTGGMTYDENNSFLKKAVEKLSDLVTTFNTNQNYYTTIAAQLPNEISYSIGGQWTTPMNKITEYINNAVFNQATTIASMATTGQNSLIHNLTTMSVWQAPNPLKISLTLQCIDDIQSGTNVNTLEAIDLLSRWALPYGVNALGTYTGVPGPAVPGIKLKHYSLKTGEEEQIKTTALKLQSSTQRTGRLSLAIGGMLFLDWCILTDIKVSYPNTKAMYLHDYASNTFSNNDAGIRLLPIRTNITLTFQTIQGLTQTNFRNMLALVEQKYSTNDIETDITGIQDWIRGAADDVKGVAKNVAENVSDKALSLTNSIKGLDLNNSVKGFSLNNLSFAANSVPNIARGE